MELKQLERFIEVVKKLRDPNGGCPWDREQTHQSLTKYLIEESYEFTHAAQKDSDEKMEEEIGDVLLQVILHSQIASERGAFNIESVAKKIADKIIHRHPHVFNNPDGKSTTVSELHDNWEKLKLAEKKEKKYIPLEDSFLPALMSANKIGIKTNKIKFDWSEPLEVIKKVEEEWSEFKVEIQSGDKKKIKEELGDFLFTVAQLARHLEIDPEECLTEANTKFINRFQKMEELMKADGHNVLEAETKLMESYWAKVKRSQT
jgi:MazG family protein